MFERRSLEQILSAMIGWSRGVSTKITDFRVGSRVRTIYEAVGIIIEEFEDRVYRAIKVQIPENLYSVFDFNKIPAQYAGGQVVFSRSTPATKDYLIAAGSVVQTQATTTTNALTYTLAKDVTLATGTTSVEGTVICTVAGTVGNTASGTVTVMTVKPQGVESVSNPTAFYNGQEEETPEAQKARFKKFINAQAKGVLQSIEYGAETAVLKDSNDLVTERVRHARAYEYLPERRGYVDVYLWNGVNESSEELIAEVQKILFGYYNKDGLAVYGYKPAGIFTNVYSVILKGVTIKMEIVTEDWTDFQEMEPLIEAEIDAYSADVTIGQELIQTALESRIKYIDGIKDVKLMISTDDGATFSDSNVPVLDYEIIRINKPLQYV